MYTLMNPENGDTVTYTPIYGGEWFEVIDRRPSGKVTRSLTIQRDNARVSYRRRLKRGWKRPR